MLIGIVIATFIIAAVFVGYHASQAPEVEEGESHNIKLKPLSIYGDSSQTFKIMADQIKIL